MDACYSTFLLQSSDQVRNYYNASEYMILKKTEYMPFYYQGVSSSALEDQLSDYINFQFSVCHYYCTKLPLLTHQKYYVWLVMCACLKSVLLPDFTSF
jgi:hypothetical protein